MEHPAYGESAAPGDNIGHPLRLAQSVYCFQGYATVHGHEVNAVLCLLLDRGEEMFYWQGHNRAPFVDGFDSSLVDGDSAQGERGGS
jgi:hypothetical protein